MVNIAILASGNGSNFEAITKYLHKKKIARVSLLVYDNPKAYVKVRAEKLKIKSVFVDPKKFKGRREFEQEIIKTLKKHKIKKIVLAGFMRVLSPYFVRQFPMRIINIHPSLLPAFPGTNAIRKAYQHAVKITGVTVHFVDEKVDHGPIIWQESVKISAKDTLKTLEAKIHKIEHKIYPKIVEYFCQAKIKVNKRKVKIG